VTDKRIKWGPGRQEAFLDWIIPEIQAAESARASLDRKWERWLEQYRAPATQATRQFPFPGAANYVMPVTAIDVDQLFAKFMQTIHAPANIWTIEAMNPDWTDVAKPAQDYLQWLDHALLHMEEVDQRALLELVKLGTCIYKTDWVYEYREIGTYDETGNRIRAMRQVSHPRVDHVRLTDFLLPAYSYAIQADDQGGAPWVAEKHRARIAQLESIADAHEPYLPNYGKLGIQKIKEWLAPSQPEYDDTVQGLQFNHTAGGRGGEPFEKTLGAATNHQGGGSGMQPKTDVEWREIHARFATQGSSEDDIVVELHIPTRTIIRGTYLRYHHGQRPYEKAVYFPTEGFHGIGVCEQKEVFQALESDLANYTNDNVLLGNATCLGAKQGANVAPGEPVYPGKIFITDGNPKDELMPFQLGAGVYPGLDGLRDSYSFLGRQRTGVSDLNSGNIQSLPSRTPATTVQSLLEEGARRPDLTLKDIRRCLSRVGLRIIQLIQQHATPGHDSQGHEFLEASVSVLGDETGMGVMQMLSLPMQSPEFGLAVNLTATSANANKELMKQSMIGLLQIQMQTAPVFLQLMMQAIQFQGTPIGQIALDSAQGMAFTQKRLMEQFDIRNLSEVVPTIPKDPVGAITDPQAALQLLSGGGGAAQGSPPAPGMEAPAGPVGAGSAGGM
jgi:hypothetical protein